MEQWIQTALELGFSAAGPLDPATLQAREDVRSMCRADVCRSYGKNWMCPPHCGSVEECAEAMERYTRGILVQTTGQTEKAVDTKAYRRTERRHLEQFYRLAELAREACPGALCLGCGGCRICDDCAWPEPCRFPDRACASMEAYGLFITQVCRDNGLPCHYGERTITYTSCILFP